MHQDMHEKRLVPPPKGASRALSGVFNLCTNAQEKPTICQFTRSVDVDTGASSPLTSAQKVARGGMKCQIQRFVHQNEPRWSFVPSVADSTIGH